MGIDRRDPTPLYSQIIEDIKFQISTGQLVEGDKIDSQSTLAKNYKVSLITVKKALAELVNDGFIISRVGKVATVARKKTIVDYSKSSTIGLVLRDLNNPFFSRIVGNVEKRATEKGYNIFLKSTLNQAENADSQIDKFRQLGVNGLIIASMAHVYHPSEMIRKLHDEEFPYIMVSYIENSNIYFIGTDHELGGFMATEHLINLGYEKIGYINGEKGNLVGELRNNGYQKALVHHSKPINNNYIYRLARGGGWNDYESGYAIGQQICKQTEKPDAVFVYNDLSALGFQKAILEGGLKIPDNIAIVGFDGIKRGVTAPVPLTTIQQPTDKIGSMAIDLLSNRINGIQVMTRTILEPQLIIRESCGAK